MLQPNEVVSALRTLRVLCVLPGVPMPADTGGLQRTLSHLKALDAHFELQVIALHRPGQDARGLRRALRAPVHTVPFHPSGVSILAAELQALLIGEPLRYRRYVPRALVDALVATLRTQTFDVIHFDHLHTAQLAPLAHRLQPSARVVLDEHNVEAQIVERMAPLAAPHWRPALRWHGARLRRMEGRIVRAVDAVLACSALDAQQLDAMGARHVEVVPNGATFEVAGPAPSPRCDVVFVGSFDWWPNVDGALFLAREIWPRCARALDPARLVIVGRSPPAAVRALASERVVVTGAVHSVAPHLRRARVAAVPLRAGSGTRLKILEAWAHGLPVVTTPLGAEGLPVRHGENALVVQEPAAFADALVRVCRDDALAARLTAGALRAAEAFHPERIGSNLAAFYRDLLAGRGSLPAAPA